MGEVAVTIGGRRYPVSCDDGQEEHVAKLAAYVDRRAQELSETVGRVGEVRLLLMACLVIADELADAYDELDRLQSHSRLAERRAASTQRRGSTAGMRLSSRRWPSASRALPAP